MLYCGFALGSVYQQGMSLIELLNKLNTAIANPTALSITSHTPRMILICTLLYAVCVGLFLSHKPNTRMGEEHGSAYWGNARQICAKFRQKPVSQNLLLTKNFAMGLDGHRHKRNLNVLVIGGSGAGKTRGYVVPNVLQCNTSLIITDPKGEVLRKTGGFLKQQGYAVKVFDLINPDTSFCYNPLAYLHSDKDVLQLINNLIKNTTPPNSTNSDPFWEKSETALLQALVLYLYHEAPPEEQNFSTVLEMLVAAEVKENEEDYESPLDILFSRLAMREPDHIAVKQYAIYRQSAGKTAKSILVSVGVRLAAFNIPQIARLTITDELNLHEFGEKKTALFCLVPDSDSSMNYLVGMIYSQLIQTLYLEADRKHKGRLPMPVHCLMDEYANLALPKEQFLSALATMRSRNIFCSIILQNLAQIKAIYKDSAWESLVGLCDSFVYLGGNEKETHKYVSELLGKETITVKNHSHSKGRSGSYSTSVQKNARELLTPDEVRLLPNESAILFVRGERPMKDGKINLLSHRNIRHTEDGGAQPYDYAEVTGETAKDDIVFDPERLGDYEILEC